jgi:hypothetical protein
MVNNLKTGSPVWLLPEDNAKGRSSLRAVVYGVEGGLHSIIITDPGDRFGRKLEVAADRLRFRASVLDFGGTCDRPPG